MANPRVRKVSRLHPTTPSDSPPASGFTAYVVDAPEIVAGDHPLFDAILDLGVAANRFAADTQVLVVISKADIQAGTDR